MAPETVQRRVADYCARYGVSPNREGLPPFPTGKRETRQHREWMAVYKAHNRLARRNRGQCERCGAPVSDGAVFCEEHRAGTAARAGSHGATLKDRERLFAAQRGRCPVCGDKVALLDNVDHSHATGEIRSLLHQRCKEIVGFVEAAGPESLDRLRAYLWPTGRATLDQ